MPDVLSALGAGWSEIDRDFLGEFALLTYLETAVPEEVAADAAAGWGGDRHFLLKGPSGERLFVALIVWDTPEDAQEFAGVALDPLGETQPGALVDIQGDRTILIVAPSGAAAQTVLAAF